MNARVGIILLLLALFGGASEAWTKEPVAHGQQQVQVDALESPQEKIWTRSLSQTAKMIEKAHALHGGSTFNPTYGGDMRGAPMFALSIFPERAKSIDGLTLTAEQIASYIQSNLDLLQADSWVGLGTWFDREKKTQVLDVVITLPNNREGDLQLAEQLGELFNQKAIYDLKNFKEIFLKFPQRDPAQTTTPQQRLKQMKQLVKAWSAKGNQRHGQRLKQAEGPSH